MEEINRRSALTIGLATAAATPLFALATPVGAAEIVPTYGPNDGKEIAPGVRIVEVGKWDFEKTGIKSILVLDAVFQPGAADKESVMDNDMVCLLPPVSSPSRRRTQTRNLTLGKVTTIPAAKAKPTMPRT
jgi:hypothetical protein